MSRSAQNVAWFSEVSKEDIALVGGKGANLGEMTRAKFPVPNGFIVTSNAYYKFVKENKLDIKIKHLISTINFNDSKSLEQVSIHIKKFIREGEISSELTKDILSAYKRDTENDDDSKNPSISLKRNSLKILVRGNKLINLISRKG